MGLALRKERDPLYLDFHLHPKQALAFDTIATEVLYGGAAGGGKSHLMRCAAITWAMAIPGLQIYLFRRVYDDLIKNHMEGPKGFRAMLAPWTHRKLVRIIDDTEIRFPNGSKIFLCHCQHDKDMYKYQGAEIHVLLVDELTHFNEPVYRFLRNRVRMVGVQVPPEYKGRFPRIMCSANPGNIGHLWVKETFVSQGEFTIVQQPETEGGLLRQYVPARLNDNPSLVEDDPGYEARLGGLGSASLVKAMRDGDWNVIEGAFFDEIDLRYHAVRPFEIPKDWTRFIAMDWGSAEPFSIGWYTIVPDDTPIPGSNRYLPRGALLRYREWYGVAADRVTGKIKPDKGLKMDVEAVALGIKRHSKPDTDRGIKYAYVVVDPSMKQQNGGPSLAERLIKKGIRNIRFGDNSRVPQRGAMGGWDQCRARLRGHGWDDENHVPTEAWAPMFYAFTTCTHFWRTVPVLQHDPDKPEDLNTEQEDHAGDEWRYACMSRPFHREPAAEKAKPAELEYEAIPMPDGTTVLKSNIGIRQLVEERNKRAKKRRK